MSECLQARCQTKKWLINPSQGTPSWGTRAGFPDWRLTYEMWSTQAKVEMHRAEG
jgi:hypothetical protein